MASSRPINSWYRLIFFSTCGKADKATKCRTIRGYFKVKMLVSHQSYMYHIIAYSKGRTEHLWREIFGLPGIGHAYPLRKTVTWLYTCFMCFQHCKWGLHLSVSVIPSLGIYPLNIAILAGQRMELKCDTSHNETVNRWTVTRGERKFEWIYKAKQQTNSGEKQRDEPAINSNFPYFGVQFLQNGDYIHVLYSNRTGLKDAGIYTCFKNRDSIQRSAQLTVFGEYCFILSNMILFRQ